MQHIRLQKRTIGQQERIAKAEERLKLTWLNKWCNAMPKGAISKADYEYAVKEAEKFAARKVAEIAALISLGETPTKFS